MFETFSSIKSNAGSSKKKGKYFKNSPPKTSNNIYAKFSNKPAETYLQQRMQQKESKQGEENFKNLCNARIQANTLRTSLNNDFFLLKKRIDTEKRQVVDFLDSIMKIAEGLKQNVLNNYDSEFSQTFEYYTQQINTLGEQRTALDQHISSYDKLSLSNEGFIEVIDRLKLQNQLCQFPFENQELRNKAQDQIITLLQEVAAPVPVKKTLSPIDDYNEYIQELKNKANISQASTVPKKAHKHNRDFSLPLDTDNNAESEKELNLTVVKNILSRNDEVLNKIAEFSLDELKDETESQIIEEELHNSLSSVQLKCSEDLTEQDDSKILLITN